jgi:hypothetical protein
MAPKQFAECMKDIDMELFRKIPRRAFVVAAYRAPRSAFAKHFNETSEWVASTILSEAELVARAKVMGWFVELADACVLLKDFHGFLAVVCGLRLGDIRRLQETWAKLDRGAKKMWARCEELADPGDGSFPILLETFRSCTPPCVPHVGSFLLQIERLTSQISRPALYREVSRALAPLLVHQQA